MVTDSVAIFNERISYVFSKKGTGYHNQLWQSSWCDCPSLFPLASGWMGDSRFPRTTSVTFSKEFSEYQKLAKDSDPAEVNVFEGNKVTVTVTVKPEGMALVRIGKA